MGWPGDCWCRQNLDRDKARLLDEELYQQEESLAVLEKARTLAPDDLEIADKIELITAVPSYCLNACLHLRFQGRGTAYFSNVRWEQIFEN